MRPTPILLICLLLSACAGSLVPPCDLEGDRPGLSLTSDDAWPAGTVTSEDGREQIDVNMELTVSQATTTELEWDVTLTDGEGGELRLLAANEANTTPPAVGDGIEVRYHRWYVGDPDNEFDSFLRLTRVEGSMFAWAASATSVDDLDVPDGIWMESGQETCRSVEDDGTSWHASMVFGGEYESVVEVDPASSTRIDDWDVTNALNRRTHFKSGDVDDTWAVEVIGFLFD